MTRAHSTLTDRDRRLLEHVAEYRLTTHTVLRRRLFVGQTLNAVSKVTRRLCDGDWLRKYPLIPPETYFVLGAAATHELGLTRLRCEPLGPQALPIELATLCYATLGKTLHRRLHARELKHRFPWMTPALTAAPHCLDESRTDAPCLELIRVDLGGSADHVVRKCTHDIERRFTLAPFQQLLQTQQFRLVVITGTAPKAAAIRASVANQHWPEGLAVHLSVVSDLFPLLARLSDAA
ncbi:MAG: hypothetical protein ACKV2Q_06195 [Planctomycetaceae bacterium]